MSFHDQPHNTAVPRYGLRVAHVTDGPGTITAVMVKNNRYLCVTRHDSGTKKGHFWASLTDVNVPPASARRGPPDAEMALA